MKAARSSSVAIPASTSRFEKIPRVIMETLGERQAKTLTICVAIRLLSGWSVLSPYL